MTYLINLFKQFCEQMVEVLGNCRASDNISFLANLLQNFVLNEIEKRDTRYLREQVEFLEQQVKAKLEGIKDEKVVTNVKDQIYRPIEMHLQKEKEASVEQEMLREIEVDQEQLRLSGSGLVEYLEKNVRSGESPEKPKIKKSMDSIDQLGDFSRRNLEFNLNSMRHQAEERRDSQERNEPVIEEVQMDKESCVVHSGQVSPKGEPEQEQKMPIKLNKKRATFKKKKKSERQVKVEEIDEILNEQEQLKESTKEKKAKKKERKKGARSKSVKSVAKKKKKTKPKTEIKSVSPFQTGQLEKEEEGGDKVTKAKSKSTRKRKKTKTRPKSGKRSNRRSRRKQPKRGKGGQEEAAQKQRKWGRLGKNQTRRFGPNSTDFVSQEKGPRRVTRKERKHSLAHQKGRKRLQEKAEAEEQKQVEEKGRKEQQCRHQKEELTQQKWNRERPQEQVPLGQEKPKEKENEGFRKKRLGRGNEVD